MPTRISGKRGGSFLEGMYCNPLGNRNMLPTEIIWFSRPYLHMYAHSNELEETAVVNLNGVNIERNPEMEALLGVRLTFALLI